MKVLSIGELLMRMTVPDNKRFTQAEQFAMHVGGSEANVAIALSQLGWGARMLSALPDNDLGNHICNVLRHFGVDTSEVARIGSRIGLYFLEEGDAIRSSRIIYDRAHSSINDFEVSAVDWDKALEGVTHVHWSAITPALSKNAAELCQYAVDKANDKGITVSCDLHYRKNLWAYGKEPRDVIPQLLEKSSIVLGDPSTIQALTGLQMNSKELETIENAQQLADDYRTLMAHFPKMECVSMLLRTIHNANHHDLKSVMVTKGDVYNTKSIELHNIIDRIGGGDAYMAGLLYGLSHYENKLQGLEFALTLSALKHTIRGDYFTGKLEEVEQVMNTAQLGKIIR
ncbi:sugar kinase [Fulvivirga aurantia]|uniref:sugar kinase n=1 Tax=Fulvivirga aurantia TaxID=2529383 RepID=UPI001624DF55|nr:sugar kinase [Fulvivirga aurantia]